MSDNDFRIVPERDDVPLKIKRSDNKTEQSPSAKNAKAQPRRNSATSQTQQAKTPGRVTASQDSSVSSTPSASERRRGAINATGSSTAAVQPQPKNNSGLAIVALMLILILCAAVVFLYLQLQQAEANQQDLLDRTELLESKLLISDESANQSGAVIQAKLSTLSEVDETHMSEIRKLWVVAYDKNRPSITTLKQQTSELQKQLQKVQSAVSTVKSQSERLESLNARDNTFAGEILSLSVASEDIERQMRTLVDATNKLEADTLKAQQQYDAQQESITTFDQYRLQINQRMIKIEQQLRLMSSGN